MKKEEEKQAEIQPVAVKETKDITVKVLERVTTLQESREIELPENYSPANALKSAFLMLQEQVDMNGNLVLQSCSATSIANCLLDMVVQGLSPLKKQCYFIPYNGKLQLQRSYAGAIAVAKRVGNVTGIVSNVIYEGDVFNYGFNLETGSTKITKHETALANIDKTKIIGAYAIVLVLDQEPKIEVMNFAQIKQSWEQGKAKGNSLAHRNFPDEMAKKTVINRALKIIINSSDDSSVFNKEEVEYETTEDIVYQEIKEKSNKIEIDFQKIAEPEVVVETKPEIVPEVVEVTNSKGKKEKVNTSSGEVLEEGMNEIDFEQF